MFSSTAWRRETWQCVQNFQKLLSVLAEKKPVVECSFHTEFDDHIFVAMDAELVLFLHDLVTSYVKEKDKGAPSSRVQANKKFVWTYS